jgi:hypothetical protein
MFQVGLYARVSMNDQQKLAIQNGALREHAARRGRIGSNYWTPPAAARSIWCCLAAGPMGPARNRFVGNLVRRFAAGSATWPGTNGCLGVYISFPGPEQNGNPSRSMHFKNSSGPRSAARNITILIYLYALVLLTARLAIAQAVLGAWDVRNIMDPMDPSKTTLQADALGRTHDGQQDGELKVTATCPRGRE